MLDALLDDVLAVGSNVPAGSADSAWMFLLPTLEPAHALCIGAVPPHVAAQLRTSARVATFVDDLSTWSSPARSDQDGLVPVDLLVVGAAALGELARRPAELAMLRDLLDDDACVAVHTLQSGTEDLLGQLDGLVDVSQPRLVLEPGAGPPAAGRAASANVLGIPEQRPANAGPLLARRLRTASVLARSRVARALGRRGPLGAARAHASDLRPLRPTPVDQLDRCQAVLVGPPGADLGRPPRWVRELGETAGIDVGEARWAFGPPRGYRSQKPLFLLRDTDAEGPSFVLKITQDPVFNARLLTEASALATIAADGLADAASVPQVVAATEHGGLAVVIETAWDGQPFRAHSTAEPHCPFAARAVEWFTALGERSAVPAGDDDALHRGAVRLVDRYLDVFSPAAHHRSRLAGEVERLRGRGAPAVFVHGDPGNWNLMARADGSIGVLDWENARRGGPPGWDLLLFLKTYGTFVAEAAGRRYTTATFAEQFRAGSDLRPMIDRSLLGYAERVGVDVDVLEVLTLLCWVHQALKDASRLTPDTVASSHYRQIVDACLDDPRLVALSAPGR